MAEKKTRVPFAGTKEQETALKNVIAELKNEPGALMPIMQKAQDIYGYLPIGRPRCNVLFTVQSLSEGQVSDIGMLGYSLLCKGLG